MNKNRLQLATLFLTGTVLLGSAKPLIAQTAPENPTGVAPANYGILEREATGVVYVDKELLHRYNELVGQAKKLRERINAGETSRGQADQDLKNLRSQLSALRELIDQNKVLVEPYESFTRRDEITFPLSKSGMIVITADNVRVKGWEGPGIRCVMEKTVLGESEPAKSEFDAIAMNHEERVADNWVGITDEKRDADERAFLESESGKKMSDEARKNRARFLAEIRDSYTMYKPFQGEQINTLEVRGLRYDQGNEMITGDTRSPGGDANSGGYWRRSAKLTILVPPCERVAIRGCQETIYVNDVQCGLVLTNHESHDRDYNGTFVVDNVKGDVVIYQAPIRSLTNVDGNVSVIQTDEFCDRSTSHGGGGRTIRPAAMAKTVWAGISGDVHARILRTKLELRDMRGEVDIENEYGDTTWFLTGPVKDAAHRIASHTGSIQLITPKAALAGIPVFAFSQCGVARTSFTQQQFDDRSFSTKGRGWHGFNTSGAAKDLFFAFQRHAKAVENEDRTSGIDLISHDGGVSVDRAPSGL